MGEIHERFQKEKEMDVSQDFITYRTICPVSKKDKKLYKQMLEKQSKDDVVLEENHSSKESLNKKIKKTYDEKTSTKEKKPVAKIGLAVCIFVTVLSSLMSMMFFDYNTAVIINNISLYTFLIAFFAFPIGILILIVRLIRKKPAKKVGIFLVICILVGLASFILGRGSNMIIQYFEMIAMNVPSICMI